MNKPKILGKQALSILLVAVLMLTLVPSFATLVFAETDVTLTIIHINDRHGRMDAEPYISQMSKDIKANGGNVLILDAGDSLHGQTVTNLSKGESMVNIMNAVGYNAMAPGNHEFNFGVERLLELSEMMEFPLLAANVKTAEGDNVFQSYEIFAMNGITVGVFGLITPETLTKVDPRIVAGLIFDSPVDAATDMVKALKKENCDIIIALTHLGIDGATIPANRSEALAEINGIDVIIDGHSHTMLESGKTVGNTLIAQTGAFVSYIGVVEITVTGSVKAATASLIEIPKDDTTERAADENIIAQIKQEGEKVEPITAVVVGHTPFKLEGDRSFVRMQETNLANVITDSMLYTTEADIALYNGGGIRESIEAGDITMGQVLTTLPFSNILVTIELNGADVLKMLEHGVSKYPNLAGLFIQTAGISFTFDPDAEPGQRVVTAVMSDESPLDVDRIYTLATIEYLAAGGDGYDMLANGENLIYYGSDAEAFAAYLMTEPVIKAEPEGRVLVAESIMTRAMLVAKIYTLAGSPNYSDTVQFTDIAEHSHSGAIIWAAENGIVSGVGGGRFAPDKAITLEQMVTILYRYFEWSGVDVSVGEDITILSYEDAIDISEYAIAAMQWASSAGLLSDSPSGNLNPKGNATRAEFAAMLERYSVSAR